MCLTIGKVHYYLFFPIIAALFYSIRPIIYGLLCERTKDLNFSPFLFRLLLLETGNSLNIIFEIISICRRRNLSIENPIKSEFKKTFKKYKTKPKLIFIIIALSLCSSFSVAINAYSVSFYGKEHNNTYILNLLLSRFIAFIILNLSCSLFLKIKIHRHHLIGLFFFVVYFIIQIIFVSIDYHDTISMFSIYSVFLLIGTTMFDLLYIAYRYLMEFEYLSPYELAGLQGLCSFLILLVLNISLQNVKCNKDNNPLSFLCGDSTYAEFTVSFTHLAQEGALAFVYTIGGSVLCSTFFTMFLMLTNKYLNPTYSIFFEIIYYAFTNIPHYEQRVKFVMSTLSIVIVIIGSLIYGELILIKFCHMDYNTHSEITTRALSGSVNEMNPDLLGSSVGGRVTLTESMLENTSSSINFK